TDVTPTVSSGPGGDCVKIFEAGTATPRANKPRKLMPIVPGERSSMFVPQPTKSLLDSLEYPPPMVPVPAFDSSYPEYDDDSKGSDSEAESPETTSYLGNN